MFKNLLKLVFVFSIICISFSQLYVESTLSADKRPTVLPIGGEDIIVYRFVISGNINDEWKRVSFKLLDPSFNTEWLKIKIYKDSNNDGKFDEGEKNPVNDVESDLYGSNGITVNSLYEHFDVDLTQAYFVAIDISNTADVDSILQITPNVFLDNASTPALISNNVRGYNFALGRLFSNSIVSPTTNYYIGNEELELFSVDLRLSNDSRCLVTFNFTVDYNYEDDSVGEIRIYRVGHSSPIVTNNLTKQNNLLIGLADETDNFVRNNTKNFKITYYNNSYKDTGASFNIRLNNIIGAYHNNSAKGYSYSILENSISKNFKITGVSPNINKIDIDPRYVGGELPVFDVEFRSYHLVSTLNTIELTVTGDFYFSNTISDDIIFDVLIKKDDAVIVTISVGDYDIIADDTIKVTLNEQVKNYFVSNEFLNLTIVYVLTGNILEPKELRTKISNITYYSDQRYHNLDDLLADDELSVFEMSGEAVVRLAGDMITSNLNIIFPRGGEPKKIAYLKFAYNGIDIFDSQVHVDTFVIENKGTLPINNLKFSLIYDLNGNQEIDETDLPVLGQQVMVHHYNNISNRVTIDNTKINLDVNTEINGYFLLMEILPSANPGIDNIVLEIPEILYYRYITNPPDIAKSVIKDNFAQETVTISVSGLLMGQQKENSILPYKKQESFSIATFSVISLVEFTREINFNVEIKTNTTSSLGTLNIIKDYSGDPIKTNTNIASINIESSITNIHDPYSYATTTYDHAELTRNYTLKYYPKPEKEAGITFDVIIKDIVGSNYPSGYETKCFSDFLTVNILLSGLRVTISSALISGDYVENMDIPVFMTEYQAFYDDITFNAVQLTASPNGFNFTTAQESDRIRKISVYDDSNQNKVWDHDDKLLAEYLMNTSKLSELYLTINKLAESDAKNSALFIVYILRPSPNANLDLLISAKSAISKYFYVHSGDIQVIESNKSFFQNIILEPVDFIFTPGEDLFLTTNLEGAYDVPVLSFKLRNNHNNDSSTYNLILETNRDLYLNNDLGIKTVKIIEDIDQSNTYTSNDIVVEVINDFLSTGKRLSLNIRNTYPMDRNYLILYSLGQNLLSNSNVDDDTILRPKIYSDSRVKTAGLFPYPRNARYMSFIQQKLNVELLSLTPNKWISGDMSVTIKIINNNSQLVTINNLYPQFYEEGTSSLNVTYLYNIISTTNFPLTLNPSQEKNISFVVSEDTEFKRDRLYLDALLEYKIGEQKIRLQRRNLYSWEKLLTVDYTFDVDLPEKTIFYSDYPNYIKQIIRSRSGISLLNGDIIGNDEYLILYFKETFQNFDADKVIVVVDNVTLNMYSAEPNYRYNPQENSFRIGKFSKGSHLLTLHLYDTAGNKYPETNLSFSVYDPEQFYIKDLLVYPSKKARSSFSDNTLKVGFQLSKSCEVLLYLFNSRGESVWNYRYNASILDDHYQLLDFDGILDNGKLIPKGMYILKAIIIENGKEKDEKTTTRFIIN